MISEIEAHDVIVTVCPNCDGLGILSRVIEIGKGRKEKPCACGHLAVTCVLSWQWRYK